MSHWNYRVIRKRNKGTDEVIYQVHEVYYSENGVVEGWTEKAVEPLGETEYELREDIRYFLKAFRFPIMEEKNENGKAVLVQDNFDININAGHYFEFMDRASIALDYIYQFLGNHPLIKKEHRLKEAYDRAEEALAELYQIAGQIDHENTNNN